MRTTIRLDEELLRQARLLAARRGTTLTAVIQDAVREAIARHKAANAREPVRLMTVGGTGLRPGVDLDDSAALLDTLDV